MRSFIIVVQCVAYAACGGEKTAQEKKEVQTSAVEHEDHPQHTPIPRKLRLSKEVESNAQIKTAPVRKAALASTLSLPGEVVSNPDNTAKVASPLAGRIVKVAFQEGTQVKKGQVLLTIRVPNVSNVQADYVAAKSRAKVARANAERIQVLLGKGLAAQQEAAAAASEAESLEAAVQAYESQLSTLGAGSASELTLRAPKSGTVVVRNAVVGQPVNAEETLATIADLNELWFLGRLFEKDLARLRVGEVADVALNAYPDQPFTGRVAYISKQIDPGARTVTARIPLKNRDDRLRIGLFGTARVSTGEQGGQAVLVVPREALTEIGGKPVVFVRHGDGDFELHEVVLGASALGLVEVLSGLRESELVVVDGAFTLKSIALRATFGEED